MELRYHGHSERGGLGHMNDGRTVSLQVAADASDIDEVGTGGLPGQGDIATALRKSVRASGKGYTLSRVANRGSVRRRRVPAVGTATAATAIAITTRVPSEYGVVRQYYENSNRDERKKGKLYNVVHK